MNSKVIIIPFRCRSKYAIDKSNEKEFSLFYEYISIKWHLFYKHTNKYHTLVGRNYWVWNDSVVDCPPSPSIEWLIHRKFIVPMCLQLLTSPGCFCPRTVFENTGMNLLLRNFIVSCLYSQVRYSAEVFHALRPIVFGAVNSPFGSCMSVHFWHIYSNVSNCKFDKVANTCR